MSETSEEETEFETEDDEEACVEDDLTDLDANGLEKSIGDTETVKRGSFHGLSNKRKITRASTKKVSEKRKKRRKKKKKVKKDKVVGTKFI